MVLAFLAVVVVVMSTIPNYRIAVFIGPVWIAILAIGYALKQRASRTR